MLSVGILENTGKKKKQVKKEKGKGKHKLPYSPEKTALNVLESVL